MSFRKVIYENVKKKNIHFKTNISIYYIIIVRVTDILKFYEVLFCTFCKGLLCL